MTMRRASVNGPPAHLNPDFEKEMIRFLTCFLDGALNKPR
jgi:hypothetical protein